VLIEHFAFYASYKKRIEHMDYALRSIQKLCYGVGEIYKTES